MVTWVRRMREKISAWNQRNSQKKIPHSLPTTNWEPYKISNKSLPYLENHSNSGYKAFTIRREPLEYIFATPKGRFLPSQIEKKTVHFKQHVTMRKQWNSVESIFNAMKMRQEDEISNVELDELQCLVTIFGQFNLIRTYQLAHFVISLMESIFKFLHCISLQSYQCRISYIDIFTSFNLLSFFYFSFEPFISLYSDRSMRGRRFLPKPIEMQIDWSRIIRMRL